MLESWAYSLIGLNEAQLTGLGIVLTIVGFLAALFLRRGAKLSLNRAPYFFLYASTFGLVSALPSAWLLTPMAMQSGALWILVAFVFVAVAMGGAAFGVISHGRSVNAYGDGSGAWMAIVPIVNFVLFFKQPKEYAPGTWGSSSMSFFTVICGFVVMVLGVGMGKQAEKSIEDLARRAESDPQMQETSVEMMVRAQGLEKTLQQMAAEVPSSRIDEVTTLLGVESDGAKLRYVYEISSDIDSIPYSFRLNLVKQNCAYAALRPVIRAGAQIEHVFQRQDMSQIGTVAITRELCGY